MSMEARLFEEIAALKQRVAALEARLSTTLTSASTFAVAATPPDPCSPLIQTPTGNPPSAEDDGA